MKQKEITLTIGNAPLALKIQHKQHPEWGVKCFNYKAERLDSERYCHTFGSGMRGESVLFDDEMKNWNVVEFKK